MIEASNLTCTYGELRAVDNVTFAVGEGEIVGILGPNGAGKTTTIRMITGFLPPTSGRVTVNGRDLGTESKGARRQLGYLPENVALYSEMRVSEYLAYRARLMGMPRGQTRAAIADALDRCLLTDVERQIIGTLSKGYRQRVGLASAILHRPPVLVLDEPTVGLDPKQIIAIRSLIRELGEKQTLMISTHILPEVEQLCHRVLIFDRGRIVAEGTPAALRARARGKTILTVTIKDVGGKDVGGQDAGNEVAGALASIDGVGQVVPQIDQTEAGAGSRFNVEVDEGKDRREAIFQLAVEHGWVLLELSERRTSLEDVFVRLTTRDRDEDHPRPDEDSEGSAS